MTKANQAALGFRVKSGWAAAVLLVGPRDAPTALDRRIVELCDAEVAETKQPYHAAMGLLEEDRVKIERRTGLIRKVAIRSVAALLDNCRAAGHQPGSAGLVVGSLTDPSSIANPHIRAHALEGQLFRTVLADALQAEGLKCHLHVESAVWARAAKLLGRSETELKCAVAELGRTLGGPWRAEEKLAAMAAWLALW